MRQGEAIGPDAAGKPVRWPRGASASGEQRANRSVGGEAAGRRSAFVATGVLAAAGVLFIAAGGDRAEREAAAEAAAIAFVSRVASDEGRPPFEIRVRSSVVSESSARVRLSLHDGDDHLRVDVRLRQNGVAWRGHDIELPDAAAD